MVPDRLSRFWIICMCWSRRSTLTAAPVATSYYTLARYQTAILSDASRQQASGVCTHLDMHHKVLLMDDIITRPVPLCVLPPPSPAEAACTALPDLRSAAAASHLQQGSLRIIETRRSARRQ